MEILSQCDGPCGQVLTDARIATSVGRDAASLFNIPAQATSSYTLGSRVSSAPVITLPQCSLSPRGRRCQRRPRGGTHTSYPACASYLFDFLMDSERGDRLDWGGSPKIARRNGSPPTMNVAPPRSLARYGAQCAMCDTTATRTCHRCGKLCCQRHSSAWTSPDPHHTLCQRCQLRSWAWRIGLMAMLGIALIVAMIYLE